MKPRLLPLLAAASLWLSLAARVETARRPRYGGTLRVEIGAVVNSLDPAAAALSPAEAAARQEIDSLLYETRAPGGSFTGAAGSGPFRVAAWEPGKRLALAANADYASGRPYVDAIEIQMGRATEDRLQDMLAGRADFAEIPAEDARRALALDVRISQTRPDQLLALVFLAGRPAAQDARVREALAQSTDRQAIVDLILQREGEPAGGLLPQWSSGTAFLFSPVANPAAAKALVQQVGGSPAVALGYDAGDSLQQSVAGQIAADAAKAGLAITIAPMSAGPPANLDARLIVLPMHSPHPGEALAGLVAALGPLSGLTARPLPDAATPRQIWAAENAALAGSHVVPLAWLPHIYGLGERVRDWQASSEGAYWPFADVWLDRPIGAAAEKDGP